MELAQITALFHDRCDPFGRRVGRAVIDVDDFVSPSPSSAAAISAISGATFSASLRTGTTMETATTALSEETNEALVVLG